MPRQLLYSPLGPILSGVSGAKAPLPTSSAAARAGSSTCRSDCGGRGARAPLRWQVCGGVHVYVCMFVCFFVGFYVCMYVCVHVCLCA